MTGEDHNIRLSLPESVVIPEAGELSLVCVGQTGRG